MRGERLRVKERERHLEVRQNANGSNARSTENFHIFTAYSNRWFLHVNQMYLIAIFNNFRDVMCIQ